MSGPYETEREAAADARHIYDSPPETDARGDGCRRLLEGACRAAGLQLGAYDYRILMWLAGYEPSTCAVIAGWVTRARAGAVTGDQLATLLDALDVAADAKRDTAATCPDCEPSPAELCSTCEWRLARAYECDALAKTVRSQR